MMTPLNLLEMLGAWSLPHVWLPLTAWTLAALPLYLLLERWHSAHPLVQQHARQALLLALPLGLTAAAAFALMPEAQASAAWPTLLVLPALSTPAPVAAAPALHLSVNHALGLVTLAAGLLALGRLGRLALHAAALRRFRRALPASPDTALQHRIDDRAAAMGLRRTVQAVYSPQPVTPMTFGFLRPVVVLPETVAENRERLEMALAHELVHIRRGDYLAQWTEQVVAAVFAVHPLAAHLRRSAAAWRERACDAAVLEAACFSPQGYAALLRDLALSGSPHTATVALTEAPNQLKARINAMKDYTAPARRFLTPKYRALLLGAVLLLSATTVAACTEVIDANEAPTSTDAQTPQATATGEVYMVVEEMPEIVGGMVSITEHIEYPELARKAGIEGTVYVQFTVDEEGRVVDPVVQKGAHEMLNKAALDAVQALEFEPGRQHGELVNVRMTLPIRFQLAAGEAGAKSSILEEAGITPSDVISRVEVNKSGPTPTLYLRVKPGTTEETVARIRQLMEAQFDARVIVEKK